MSELIIIINYVAGSPAERREAEGCRVGSELTGYLLASYQILPVVFLAELALMASDCTLYKLNSKYNITLPVTKQVKNIIKQIYIL